MCRTCQRQPSVPRWAPTPRLRKPARFGREAGGDDRRRWDFFESPQRAAGRRRRVASKNQKTKTVRAETKNVSELDCKRPIEAQGVQPWVTRGRKKISEAPTGATEFVFPRVATVAKGLVAEASDWP
jgi:hypothetical protein